MANNPGDPESASMEVSETKLVNFAEKTRFDVTSSLTNPATDPPRVGLYGRKLGLMERDGFTMVLPDINDYVGADGTWTNEIPTFRIEYKGVIYDRPEDVPGIDSTVRNRLDDNISLATSVWTSKLGGLIPQTQAVTVFQLDPNQLLTVSDGYKVLLCRPRSGR